jgi:hypothetical protein
MELLHPGLHSRRKLGLRRGERGRFGVVVVGGGII